MSFRSILAALALALAPLTAGAVTIPTNGSVGVNIGDTPIGSFVAPVMSPVTFEVVANEAMRISGQATALNVAGFTGLSIFYGKTGSEVAVAPEFLGANGSFVLKSIQLAAGEAVSVIFNFASIGAGSGGQVSFQTSVVPLPAAGWMLISALGGMGLLARRRNKVA